MVYFISDVMKPTEEKADNSLENEKTRVSTGQNIAIIFGTIIFPVIGIAMGYTYYKQDSSNAKKNGKELVNIWNDNVFIEYSTSYFYEVAK